MFYYCLSHSSGGAFVAQLGLEEVLFVQKVYNMSTVQRFPENKQKMKYARILFTKANFYFLWKFHES